MREAALKRLSLQRNTQVAYRVMTNNSKCIMDLTCEGCVRNIYTTEEMKQDVNDIDIQRCKTMYETILENRWIFPATNNDELGVTIAQQTNIQVMLDTFVLSRASVLLAGGNKVQHWHSPEVCETNVDYLTHGELYIGMVYRLQAWKEVTDNVNSFLSVQGYASTNTNLKNWRTLYMASGAGMADVHSPRWYCTQLKGDVVMAPSITTVFSGNAGRPRDILVCCCWSKKDPAAARVAAITGNNLWPLLS